MQDCTEREIEECVLPRNERHPVSGLREADLELPAGLHGSGNGCSAEREDGVEEALLRCGMLCLRSCLLCLLSRWQLEDRAPRHVCCYDFFAVLTSARATSFRLCLSVD